MMLLGVEKNGRKNMEELWADKVRNYTLIDQSWMMQVFRLNRPAPC
jgi:hypothetical protein